MSAVDAVQTMIELYAKLEEIDEDSNAFRLADPYLLRFAKVLDMTCSS